MLYWSQINQKRSIMSLNDTLHRWNVWGTWELRPGYARTITPEIIDYLDVPEIIALIGPRRSGKSTVLYQIMQHLLESGIEPKALLHVNFEEPELTPILKLKLLDEIYETYRSHVYPQGKVYLFFDEIQNIPEWERWVRSRHNTDEIKVFVTGSSAMLMSRELATLLTGRHLTFTIYPLSFSEVLQFCEIEEPQEPFANKAKPEIQHVLLQYMKWGGFPRVVLAHNDNQRERLLKEYFNDILFKDVILRHQIRDAQTLQNIAIYLLKHTSSLIAAKRLANIFQVSHDLAQSYATYLQEAFLFDFVSFYSLKAAETTRNAKKVHALDLGMRRVVSLTHIEDYGCMIESMVYHTLLRTKKDGIYYWHDKSEIDFLTRQGITITKLIQVAYKGLDDNNTLTREVSSLVKATEKFPEAKKYLIAWEVPDTFPFEIPSDIQIVPLWQFLLNHTLV